MFLKSIKVLTITGLLVACGSPTNDSTDMDTKRGQSADTMKASFANLGTYIEEVKEEMELIGSERRSQLEKIAHYIKDKVEREDTVNLLFICSHNSRRSIMSQVWAQTAAHHFGLGDKFFTYSGGTEATEFNQSAADCLERVGFKVENPGGRNPHQLVSFADDIPPIECFSKKYDDDFNPKSKFAAIMTCAQADEDCPLIPGAETRIPIPYEDPGVADGTPREAEKYDERCRQIATEMFYIMSLVKPS